MGNEIMRVPTYFRGGDDESLVPTGETTIISAEAGAKVIKVLLDNTMCDLGRYEQPDYEAIEEVLLKNGLIDEDYVDPDWEN